MGYNPIAGELAKVGLVFYSDIKENQVIELSPNFKGGLIFVSIGNKLSVVYTEDKKNGGAVYTGGNEVKFFVKGSENTINFYFENGKWYVQNGFTTARTVQFYLVPIYK